MAYKDELSKLIDKSRLSIREIANRCTANGVPLTHSYISQLKSGKVNTPADKISTEISKVCGGHKDLLVIAAYLDNAPDTLINYIKKNKDMLTAVSLKYYKDKVPNVIYEFMVNYLNNISLTDFIIISNSTSDVTENNTPDINSIVSAAANVEVDTNNVSFSFELPINDDSMSPLLPKNSRIYFEYQSNYKNGDIICFREVAGREQFIVRKLFYQDDLIVMNPVNTEYKPVIYKTSDITIFGKVKRVTTQFFE